MSESVEAAREEWEHETANEDRTGYPSLREQSGTTRCLVAKADTLIAALQSELDSLKVCSTCQHFDSFGSATFCRIECPERVHAYDHERSYDSTCQYEPSRWENAYA